MVLTHETDAAIKRAMIRATARNIQATVIDEARSGYDRTVYYDCGAFSHVGSHRVALSYTSEGVTAVCDCEAGQSGKICHHVAAALMAEEMPQDPQDPEERLVTERSMLLDSISLCHRVRDYDGARRALQRIEAIDNAVRALHVPALPANFIRDLMNPGEESSRGIYE